jgi:glycerophosphoryl diester phosphodiesterase
MRCENIDRMAPLFAGPPVLCGHRGMGVGTVLGHAENTLPSFLAAAGLGLPWVEVDVRVTADDVLVCRHDPVVEDGRFVIAMTAAETDALGLLRFADLLDGLPPAIGVDVEVKSSLEDALRPRQRTTAALVGRALARREANRPLLVTSFDAAALTIAREHAAVPTGLLTWLRFPLRKAIPAAVHLGAAVVLPHFSSLGAGPAPARIERTAAEYVALAHEAGLEVATWAPSPEEAEPLLAAGVDCLIVDHVDAGTWTPRRARLTGRRGRA